MKKDTGQKRRILLKTGGLIFAAILSAGICKMPGTALAKEETPVSRGSLVYEGDEGRAAWYAEDISLLQEKLSSIPEQCYDPVCYTHDHSWVYQDIGERTHTRHCDGCGKAMDSISGHTAAREEYCVISYGEGNYNGKRYICDCGWQWIRETAHNLLYEPVDSKSHRSRCALEGTAYCQGCESFTEEHYAYYYVRGRDDTHHKKVCLDCGWQEEETCSFTLEEPPMREGAEEGEPEQDTSLRWCVCGNCRKTEEAAPPTEETEEKPEEPKPPAEGTEEKPEEPEPPAEETGDMPEEPEPPAEETGDIPEEPEPPAEETGDMPEEPEPPAEETEDMPGEPGLPAEEMPKILKILEICAEKGGIWRWN